MRGKRAFLCAELISSGITPACAGKTIYRKCCVLWCWDHPRMCGENINSLELTTLYTGSPPHVRGKLCSEHINCYTVGITPACAGKTVCSFFILVCGGDHPRMCGENNYFPLQFRAEQGSPPHVRGKHVKYNKHFCMIGITPACAGKTA